MNQLNPKNPIYDRVLADFRSWRRYQDPHIEGMVGQRDNLFPCKAAHAVAVYDYEKERFTHIKVMFQQAGRIVWYEIVL